MKALINSFNGGEVTPLMIGRVDLDNMRKACVEMTNFVPRVFGGAFRRPPMMHVASAIDPTRHARLIPFAFSSSKKFQIELGHLQFRVFNADTGAVVYGPAAAPWTDAQLDAVQFVQVNDIMWLVHPDVQERELTHVADNNWTLNPIPWGANANSSPPMRDENVGATQVQLASVSGSGVIMTSDADLFQAAHVGSFWKVGHYRDTLSVELDWLPTARQSAQTADIILTDQQWQVSTTGLWDGTVFVEKWNDTDGAYDVLNTSQNITGSQISVTGTDTGKVRLRVRDVTVSPGSTCTFTIGIWDGTTLTSPLTITFAPPGYLTGTSPELSITGRWDLATYGRWAGDMYLETKNAAGTWDILRNWTGAMDRNISAFDTVDTETVFRMRGAQVYAAPASDIAQPRWIFEATDALIYGLVKVAGYSGPRQVTVDIIKPVYSINQTTWWSEGAFSAVRGYPTAITLHEQRLVFAATKAQPQNIWGSVSGDFRNFNQTGLADGSYSYQIGAQESNPIVWMASQDGIIVGTQGDEWLIYGGTNGSPITPSNVFTKRQSTEGSSPVQARICGSVVLFVDRTGFHIREYLFDWQTQNYTAPYVTQLFSHRTLSGIRCFAVARTPDRTIWAVTNDGMLLSCAYRREEEVIAWARHETVGTVESVSVVYGLPAGGDEVWLVVNRNGTRRIERLRSGFWADLERGNPVFHLDAAVAQTGSFSSVTGLGHLEGQEVGIVADGAEIPNARVVGGAVAVPVGTQSALVGLNFTSRMQPMPFELPLQDGTAQGRKFRAAELALLLYKTQAGTYADSPTGQKYPIIIRQSTDDADAPPPAFTGLKRLQSMSAFNDSVSVILETSSAMPLNILSLIPTLQVYGS